MTSAVLGGAFIGAACGAYRLTSSRLANPGEALRAVISYESSLLTPACGADLALVVGLLLGGLLCARALPTGFGAPPEASPILGLAGLALGLGTALSNGCTSHVTTGVPLLSARALVALATLVPVAFGVASLGLGAAAPAAPAAEPLTADAAERIALLAKALAVAGAPTLFLTRGTWEHNAYCGLWTGVCFAIGACVGGLVNPSVLAAGLTLAAPDPAPWTVFGTATAISFACFRLAPLLGVSATPTPYYFMSTPPPYAAPAGVKHYPLPPTSVDAAAIVGAALFGAGWALAGLCPGPLLVSLAANPTAGAFQLLIATFAAGVLAAPALRRALGI
jgi:uncharacterized membrane protein YedE/YeeE